MKSKAKVGENVIDVKELISRLSQEELIESANNYWSKMSVYSDQCYKPFNIQGASRLLKDVSIIFEMSDFKKGQRVLDFGCGTGWLSNGLSDCGLNVSGVDIAENAAIIARQFRHHIRPVRYGQNVESLSFDGIHLPFEDAEFDRIVCFDSFHHVANQRLTLQEFYRVLKPGGRVAFIEPGKNHSLAPMSQYEMRHFNVIENDIDLDTIQRDGREVGFQNIQVFNHLGEDFIIELSDSENSLLFKMLRAYKIIVNVLNSTKRNAGQNFYIIKDGKETVTSVSSSENSYRIESLQTKCVFNESVVKVKVYVTFYNDGNSTWLSDQNKAGKVNIGISKQDLSGKLLDRDFQHINLSAVDIPPDNSVDTTFDFDVPRNEFLTTSYQLDLVSEGIAWFCDSKDLKKIIIEFKDQKL